MPEEIKFTDADVTRFLRWKGKRAFPEAAIQQQTDLREFKEKYGVDRASNFHCPWCFMGRLYLRVYTMMDKQNEYICRGCELQFTIECLQQEELDKMIERKRQERKERRERAKTDSKEATLIATLTVEALHFKEITCQGCGQKIPPDVEYCTCGWKNPLVGLGNN